MATEHRTIELKVTKRRLTQEEFQAQQETVNPGSCGNWYIKIQGGQTYTCRICHTQGDTGWPYEECVLLPQ